VDGRSDLGGNPERGDDEKPERPRGPGKGAPRTYRRPKLSPDEREHLTAALLRHLIKPGLVEACRILIAEMIENNDVSAAQSIIKTAKELVQKGFPEPGEGGIIEELAEELEDLEDDRGQTTGSRAESPEPPADEPRLEEPGSDPELLPGEDPL